MPTPFQDPPRQNSNTKQPETKQTETKSTGELLVPNYKVFPGVTMPQGYNYAERALVIQEINTMEKFRKEIQQTVLGEKAFKLDLEEIKNNDGREPLKVTIIGKQLKAAHGELEKCEPGKTSDIKLTFEAVEGLSNKLKRVDQEVYIKTLQKIGITDPILKGLSIYSNENEIIINGPRNLASPKTSNPDEGASGGSFSIRAGELNLRQGIKLEELKFRPIKIQEINITEEKNLAPEGRVDNFAKISFERNLPAVSNSELKILTCNGYAVPANSAMNVTSADGTTTTKFQMLRPNERISYSTIELSPNINENPNGTFEMPLSFKYNSTAIPGERKGNGCIVFNKDGNPTSLRLRFAEGRDMDYQIPYKTDKK